MDSFGDTDPRKMPLHFFWGTLDMDYSTAIPANVGVQDYTVAPRHWYIDARFRCAACNAEFAWPAQEQQAWYETYRFYVDSRPTLCRDCRAKRRDARELRKEYDALVSTARAGGAVEQKRRIVQIVEELETYWRSVPDKMRETRDVFRKQLTACDPQ